MADFIRGKTSAELWVEETSLFYSADEKSDGSGEVPRKNMKRVFSKTAQAVFNAGRELWRHYHKQPKCDVNASLYDIREHFQGRDAKGKMNVKSGDEIYNGLIGGLRAALKTLAQKIEPKVYEHGFLKE
jgi:hypothetical protein